MEPALQTDRLGDEVENGVYYPASDGAPRVKPPTMWSASWARS